MSASGYYQHHVFMCENQRQAGHPRSCCAAKGAQALRDYAKQRIKTLGKQGKGKIRINSAGCLDRCELGPVLVIYPEECWYHVQTTADIDAIIEQHLVGGMPVASLQLHKNALSVPVPTC